MLLPHVEEFKYLEVLLLSEGGKQWELDRWIGASVEMLKLYWDVVGRRDLGMELKILIYWSVYIPTFIYGELCVVTERVGSSIQEAEMSIP